MDAAAPEVASADLESLETDRRSGTIVAEGIVEGIVEDILVAYRVRGIVERIAEGTVAEGIVVEDFAEGIVVEDFVEDFAEGIAVLAVVVVDRTISELEW